MSENRYLQRKAREAGIGSSGRASEKKLTKTLKGRGRPASGALLGAKGDISAGDFLLEAKSTINGSLGVKHDWLLKIASEARSEHKDPALSVSFVREDGTPHKDGEWVMLPLYVFRRILAGDAE